MKHRHTAHKASYTQRKRMVQAGAEPKDYLVIKDKPLTIKHRRQGYIERVEESA